MDCVSYPETQMQDCKLLYTTYRQLKCEMKITAIKQLIKELLKKRIVAIYKERYPFSDSEKLPQSSLQKPVLYLLKMEFLCQV